MFGAGDEIGIKLWGMFEGHAQGPVAILALVAIVFLIVLRWRQI